jgi:hypothetical protein
MISSVLGQYLNNRKRRREEMLRFLTLTLVLLAAMPASARNITSEVQYYRDIRVNFSENAKVCGLSDDAPLVGLAKEKLSAMDVPHNPDGLVDVVLNVTATGGGVLKQRCIAYLQLQLQSDMTSTFLNANAYGGKDQTFVMLSQREYTFPMVFYQTGTVYGDLAPSMSEKTLEILSGLLDNLAVARSLK